MENPTYPTYQRVNLKTAGFKWWVSFVAMIVALLIFMPPFTRALNKLYPGNLSETQKYWISFSIQLVIYFLFVRLLMW
jgi:hypothetical protein